jgi:glycosyltransferase involved in cell wall biosynthesis
MAHTHRSRIVFLIDSLGMGGAERMLVSYLRNFDTARFEPRVCTLAIRDGNPMADEILRMGIPVDLVRVRYLRDPLALPRLIRYLRRQRADLLHTQLEFADNLGSMAARVLSIPVVATLHTFDNPPRGTRIYWRLRLRWWSLRYFCSRVIAVSEGARQHHIRMGNLGPEKVVTVYNGIDLSAFMRLDEADRLAKRQSLGIPPYAPVLITVAVLRPAKGIQHLLEALSAIIEVIPDVRYLVVGSGEYDNSLRELARTRGIADRVIFTGVRNDVPDLLAISDVFVLPTLDDALPTVLAEAMAAQKPIVASNVGGVPEMVEHGRNGLLVSPADPGSLAAACIRLLQDERQAQAMARAGWEVAEQRFNIHTQVQQLGDLYQELLAKGGKWKGR